MKTINYTMELPIFKEPTSKLKKMIEDLSNSSATLCEITYQQERLTFLTHALDADGNMTTNKIVFIPFSKHTTLENVKRFNSMVGKFCSLFHCSLVAKEDERRLSFSLTSYAKDLEKHGSGTQAVIKIVATPLTEAADKTYNCLFPYIDLNNEVLCVEHLD